MLLARSLGSLTWLQPLVTNTAATINRNSSKLRSVSRASCGNILSVNRTPGVAEHAGVHPIVTNPAFMHD